MKFMFIFAHPDDETFSSGGTIKKLTLLGHKVNLITATKGEAGEVGNPPVTTKEKLGETREKELRRAAKILGISHIYFLDLIDGTLKSLKNDVLKNKIFHILKKEKPDVIVTFDKTGASNHPDHKAVSNAVTNLFSEYKNFVNKYVKLYHTAIPRSNLKKFEKNGLSYNAFGKMKGTKDDEITTASDISKTLKTKIKALKQHKTQHQDWERFLKRTEVADLKKEFFKLISENNLA